MNAISLAVALAVGAWSLANLFLMLTLAGAATATDQTVGTRLWICTGILVIFLAVNAYSIDQLGRHFGF